MKPPALRAWVLDDEALAVKRLCRMLAETGRVTLAGSGTDAADALEVLRASPPDILFLDIEMPGMNGFELLAQLDSQPLVVFTTAYDRYALRAFEVNSIDYLLKPIEMSHLERALDKIERLRGAPPPQWHNLVAQLASAMRQPAPEYAVRLTSRLGERIQLLDVPRITHIYAQDKLTYAVCDGKSYAVDYTVSELEQKLDPREFVRIHRSTLVNITWVKELDAWFGGKLLVRLKDGRNTELQVARERVAELKQRLL